MMKKVRILQVLPGGSVRGGMENFVMNYYRKLVKYGIQFDFLYHYKTKGYYDDEIIKLGGHIYYLSVREDKNIFKYISQLSNLFSSHRYTIVHGHMPGLAPIYFALAKLYGVKIRISHCHVTDTERTVKGKVLKLIIKIIPAFANIYFACSHEAGIFMYGNSNFQVINNAISVDKYLFNAENRAKLREEYNLRDKFVVGHVGRFDLQKNHKFLVEIFAEIYRRNSRARLLLIGEGPLEDKIKKEIEAKGLQDVVIFLGARDDVNVLYSVMDCFVLPSLFEGCCIVGVEAQAAGLPCFVSDVCSKDMQITDAITFISLDLKPNAWADIILKTPLNREMDVSLIKKDFDEHGYSIDKAAKIFAEKYLSLLER